MPPERSLRLAAHLVPQVLARPGWLLDMVRDVRGRGGDDGAAGTDASAYRAGLQLPNMAACPLTWDEIAELRRRWAGAFVVKGVLTGPEAARAADAGADAVVVSNHGGRQLDGAPATMRMLPEVLDAVGGRVEVLVDGGVRRGVDVARALALGARAVLIGRPYLYGVAAAGQAGVEQVLAVLATELRHTLTLLGVADVSDLGPQVLVRPPQVSSGTP
jgi:isopentenyl diphosphate isomerase/L-lactate dehydrogenase-like FMN-dependent dehydrogenase